MKAVRLVQTGQRLELHEIPRPQPGDDDVLVRVKAAGVCHSDAHYWAGVSRAHPLPITLGHEVDGVVVAVGANVKQLRIGQRVCLHYMVTCGSCAWCIKGNEQFCETGAMIGKSLDGGYAEFINIPARSVFELPDEIPFEHGAIMMCSSATSLHALNKARMQPGESVAIFGVGGLGTSAIQLAKILGASEFAAQTVYDSVFTTPAGHSGVTFVASSGDNGARFGAEWPASSPNVLSVGGTSLRLNSSGNYSSETGWSGSGGGYSQVESEPSYQQVVQKSGVRVRCKVDGDLRLRRHRRRDFDVERHLTIG